MTSPVTPLSNSTDSSDFGLPVKPRAIVGVGASAGGLEALERFFSAAPSSQGIAYVVIQHLSPDFKSIMDEILRRYTDMPVSLATDGATVLRDSIYLIPPNKEMIISDGKLWLKERSRPSSLVFPIDTFFRSLADDRGTRAVGVILSGSGSDGSRGIRIIHERGGLAIVQDSVTAQFNGMPLNAVATGIADFVLPAAEMPQTILTYLEDLPPVFLQSSETVLVPSDIIGVYRILEKQFNIDFSAYKTSTIFRRIERRLKILKLHNLDDYLEVLTKRSSELEALYRDLLIDVTKFFRDHEAFQVVCERALTPLLQKKVDDRTEPLRVWTAGCATGEEAYSLAIFCNEIREHLGSDRDIKVFATDAHPESLEIAGRGIYPARSLEGMEASLRQKYFSKIGENYQISPKIRKMVVFAQHNLLRDAPFTRMDFVSCRNVLIYFKQPIQAHVISLLHFALLPEGYLFLGSSESLGELRDEFIALDKTNKLFQRKRSIRLVPDLIKNLTLPVASPKTETFTLSSSPKIQQSRFSQVMGIYDSLLSQYIPSSVLVDERRQVLHIFGEAQDYLSLGEGRMSGDITDLVTGHLRLALTQAFPRVLASKKPFTIKDVHVRSGDDPKMLEVEVRPLLSKSGNPTSVLVLFGQKEEIPKVESEVVRAQPPGYRSSDTLLEALQGELRNTKDTLQSTIEELESSNEELQATNEELVASNEELQSTNEELHSVNEELYTVNAEHQRKITELTDLTADMNNLLQTSEVGILFLDKELRIRKFTRRFADLFNLMPQDVGRAIQTFRSSVDYSNLEDDVRSVIDDLKSIEREVHANNNRSYSFRINPYVREDRVDGAVISLVDITKSKQAQESIRLFSSLVDSSTTAIFSCKLNGDIFSWNSSAAGLFDISKEDALECSCKKVLPRPIYQNVRAQLENLVNKTNFPRKSEITFENDEGEEIIVFTASSPIYGASGEIIGCSFIVHDVSEAHRARLALAESENLFRTVTESVPVLIWMTDPEGTMSFYNKRWEEFFPHHDNFDTKKEWLELIDQDDRLLIQEQLSHAHHDKSRFSSEFRIISEHGEDVWMSMSVRPRFSSDDEFIGLIGSCSDVTSQKRTETALRIREEELADFFESATVGLCWFNESGEILQANPAFANVLGYSKKEVVGRSLYEIITDRETAHSILSQLKSGETVTEHTAKFHSKDARILDVLLDVSVLWNNDTFVHARCFVRDITAQKMAAESALEAVQRRDQFLAIMSHELRNPLGAIRNAVQVLLSGKSDEDTIKRATDVIERQGDHMGHLLGDLLDVSRVTYNKIEIELCVKDLRELVNQTIPLLQTQLQAIGHTLVLNLPEKPVKALVDPNRFIQIAENLITNAIKYTPEGGHIEVSVEENKNNVVFTVKDNGLGIEVSRLEQIFEPFVQLNDKHEKAQKGMGLGLTLAASLVKLHNGTISAKSDGQGQGACFLVTLPRVHSSQDIVQENEDKTLSSTSEGVSVVIVEDNADSRDMLSELMRLKNFTVESCSTGAAAIELISTLKPNVGLIDIGLPDIDGYKIVQELNKHPERSSMVLVALTGYGQDEDRQRAQEAGFDYHLVKPVDFAKLNKIFDEIIKTKRAA